MDHVFRVLDLSFTGVEEQLGAIADHQCAAITQADIAFQFAAIFQLVQTGFVGFGLDAALAKYHVAGQRGNFLLLLVTGCLGRDVGRRLAHRCVVELTGAVRFNIGAGTIWPCLGQLCIGQLITRHPIQMAVVGAARDQRSPLAFGDQLGGGRLALGFAGSGLGAGGFSGSTAVSRARRQGRAGRIRGAIPTTIGTRLAGELFGCDNQGRRYRLQCEQAAGYQ